MDSTTKGMTIKEHLLSKGMSEEDIRESIALAVTSSSAIEGIHVDPKELIKRVHG